MHTHYSFGEFSLFDHGPWLIGNGYHLGSQYDMSINTTSASTLTLDNSQQTTTGGQLIAFEPLGQTGYMAVTSPSYSILTHTRQILWNQAWHQWIIVDDATLTASPTGHSLQVRWYVDSVEASHDENGNWIFTRPADPGYLSIQMPSAVPARYSSINRSFGPSDNGNANGVEIEVTPAPVTRILSALTYSADKPTEYPTLLRDDTGKGLLVTTQPAANSPIWDWLVPAPGMQTVEKSGYLLQGDAGCVWSKSTIMSGYCLYAGTSLSAVGLLLAESSAPLSLEADFEGNRISVDSSSNATLTLYWPAVVRALTEGGLQVAYQQAGSVLTLNVTTGTHALTVMP